MSGADRSVPDPVAGLGAARLATFAVLADRLIPAAHGMPSAADIVDATRLRFVLGARPDLTAPLGAALRAELGDDPNARLEQLERDEPDHHAALQFVVVAGYYTDANVRERIGYPGQEARPVKAWQYPEYIAEGLTDQVVARGPIWRDPGTGSRATQEPKEST